MANQERNRTDEHDDVRAGSPAKPATQPPGPDDSSRSPETLTDPATGAPNPKRAKLG